ncbi:MAG: hypothetical protein HY534_07370 [Chloroflexi bacterium]|nr:hypothetical protein [Chloroflexota bacterium]
MQRKHRSLSAVMMIGFLVVSACAPSPSVSRPSEAAGPGQPAAKKTLIAVMQRDQASFDDVVSGASGGSAYRHGVNVVWDGLSMSLGERGRDLRLAAEFPSDTKGTWVVKPDGSMELTWKIVRNAKWHDGTPVTSADFQFAWMVRSDKEVAKQRNTDGGADRITRIDTLDPYTFVAHFPTTTFIPAYGEGLHPLPKHILEPAYLGPNKATMGELRYFFDEFVGTGPFKLVDWQVGSHMTFDRFDEYYKGPAKLDRLTLRIVPDANTMAANLLAEAVDAALPQGIELELALELKERWQREGTGHQLIVGSRGDALNFELMVDPLFARPIYGMTQQPVRQALLQAIDREELMQIMTQGYSQVATSLWPSDNEAWPYIKDYVTSPTYPWRYPYDPRKAQELLTSAGWTKGADGILVHQASGPTSNFPYDLPSAAEERFNYQALVRQGSGPLKTGVIIQQYWKTVGVDLDVHVLTQSEQLDQAFVGRKSGAAMVTSGAKGRRLHSSGLATEANNWIGGNNRGRWYSPTTDALIEKIEVTINEQELKAAYKAYIDHAWSLVVYHPFYWEPLPVLMLKGVTGPNVFSGSTATNNVWEWDKN